MSKKFNNLTWKNLHSVSIFFKDNGNCNYQLTNKWVVLYDLEPIFVFFFNQLQWESGSQINVIPFLTEYFQTIILSCYLVLIKNRAHSNIVRISSIRNQYLWVSVCLLDRYFYFTWQLASTMSELLIVRQGNTTIN